MFNVSIATLLVENGPEKAFVTLTLRDVTIYKMKTLKIYLENP